MEQKAAQECTVAECAPRTDTPAYGAFIAAPAVDIGETEDEFVIVTDLPGTSREAIDISLEKNILTIRAANGAGEESRSMLVQEFRKKSFERKFELGKLVDGEKVTADYQDGVLTVRLPKAAAAKPRKISLVS